MDRFTRAAAQVPAVPDDLDSACVEKATGVVELPLHIRWSGPPRRYDLADRQQRASFRSPCRASTGRYPFRWSTTRFRLQSWNIRKAHWRSSAVLAASVATTKRVRTTTSSGLRTST
jgi:hypothetical protein